MLNIPGTPSSIATNFDGRPMALKGQAGKALGTGVVFSFCGTIIGIPVLMVAAPIIAALAIKFGPYEYCTLSLCALSLVISLTGRDLVKGLVSGLLGIMLATVGLAPIDSAKRFTFGSVELNSGFALLTLLIGLFAVTEVIKAAEEVRKPINATMENQDVRIKGFGFTLKEFLAQKWNMIRSSFIGIVIGILPGIGGAISGKQCGENIIVKADATYKTLSEMIEATKKDPNSIKLGVAMDGSSYIAAVVMGLDKGAQFALVDAGGDASGRMTSLLGGHIDATIAPYTLAKEYIASGKVRALATLMSERLPAAKDILTASHHASVRGRAMAAWRVLRQAQWAIWLRFKEGMSKKEAAGSFASSKGDLEAGPGRLARRRRRDHALSSGRP